MRPNSLVLITKNDKILANVAKDNKTDEIFCRPIGGGIEFGETSLITAKREIKEELGATLENEKLLTVIENIFEFNGEKRHEITFLYSGSLFEKEFYDMEKVSILDKDHRYAEWVPISKIKDGSILIFPKESINFI